MPKEFPEIADERPQSEKKLVYAEEFKKFIGDNPGVLKEFFDAPADLIPGDVYKSGQIEISSLPYEKIGRKFFKVLAGDQGFFVKWINKKLLSDARRDIGFSEEPDGGYQEFSSAGKAKELLKEMPFAEVIEPQLGYEDKNVKIFVSAWRDLPRFENYLETHPLLRSELENRMGEIKNRLPKFRDLESYNAFYDEANNKIVLFDLAE